MPNKIVVVCGPTASGKTALGVELALLAGGEVVSADSMQIYRGMDIGTAKPTPAEMRGVPHHMLDVADPAEDYSVARYVADASACVEDILARGRLPILVGGTGLYIDHLVAGREFAPFSGRWREKLQARAAAQGVAPLYDQLRRVDPQRAERLPLSDEKRGAHRAELCPARRSVGAHRPAGGPDGGGRSDGRGAGASGLRRAPELHRHAGHRL